MMSNYKKKVEENSRKTLKIVLKTTSNVAMKWAMGDCKIIILEARKICNDMPTTFKNSTYVKKHSNGILFSLFVPTCT